ncbi:MAG TPA: DegT/DnrJ/EryC1/StrS family aminotransferase [Solirubrobacteraceae bacterium]|jgi:dTDP-3-amino-3,4,6-trideoxy-alpha-D-glucose transaminase|nr:DegT/DnrJ/EryC1/StrS family aminotransferase [Solirubrobacteraceae bacterium]
MTAPPNVPLTRLDNADPDLIEELLEAVRRIATTSAFTLGAEVQAFESEYAEYCGTTRAVGISSGTEALALALRALEVGPGDEVIVPANSFIATAEAVSIVGATPRFVDIDRETAVITADAVESAIGPQTRCVIPVHLYGRTVDLDPIVSLARDHGLSVLEDACQAHGALLDGRRAGSMGDAGCFSFYPAKNLGAWGDGGALVTNDDAIADRVMLLRSHGEVTRYHHEVVGTTARLDALQAAILRIKLRRLEGVNAERRRVGAALTSGLKDSPVTSPPPATPGGDHVYHQFVVETDSREALREHLASVGVASAIHYPVPIHRTPAYASAGLGEDSLPVAETLAARICSLPIYPTMGEAEIGRVVQAVHEFAAPAVST